MFYLTNYIRLCDLTRQERKALNKIVKKQRRANNERSSLRKGNKDNLLGLCKRLWRV